MDAAFAEVEAAHGPVEVLVANAGITKDTLLMRMSEDDFTSVIDTTSSRRLPRYQARLQGHDPGTQGASVVLISSVSGLYGAPGQINYSASKAGLVGIARSLNRELGGRGITANVVAPGFINTDMDRRTPRRPRRRTTCPKYPRAASPKRRRSPTSSAGSPAMKPPTSPAR